MHTITKDQNKICAYSIYFAGNNRTVTSTIVSIPLSRRGSRCHLMLGNDITLDKRQTLIPWELVVNHILILNSSKSKSNIWNNIIFVTVQPTLNLGNGILHQLFPEFLSQFIKFMNRNVEYVFPYSVSYSSIVQAKSKADPPWFFGDEDS
jgi:hypothetical protein